MRSNYFFQKKESRNAVWLIGGRVAQMFLSLIVGIWTARYLGPSNYGLINYGTAYVAFFTSICNLGLNSVIIKDFVDNPDEQGEAIGSALVMRLISSVLSSVMIVGIVSILDRDEPLTITVVALCTLGSVFNIFETFNFWFQYQYRSKITSIAMLLAYGVTSAYKITLLVMNKDVLWFAFATSVDYIVVATFLFFAYRRYQGLPLKFSKKKSKALIGMSYHYILSSMMVAIYSQTDKLMLKQMVDGAEVGYYATALSICSMWTFVLQAIIDSFYPTILKLHSKNKMEFERKNKQLYVIIFYVSVFVSVCFVLFGEWGIRLLYGEEYLPAAVLLKIVTWQTAFSYLGVARNAWIVSEGKQRYLKYMYLMAAIFNVAMNAVFIPYFGAEGAAVASLITQMLTSFVLPLFLKPLRPNAKLMLEAVVFKNV